MEGHTIAGRDVVRAVLDTSTLFRPSLRHDLQQAAQLGAFAGVWSPWIIAELNRVLTWNWVRRYGSVSESEARCAEAAKAMMEILLATFDLVDPRPPYPPAWESLSDRWDHPIWAAAKVGHARYVVSENTRDYPPAGVDGRHIFEGIEYLPGAEFLRRLVEDTL